MISKSPARISRFSLPTWSVPLALLALSLLVFGWRGLRLGLYWDDYVYIWFSQMFGQAGVRDSLGSDRPFLGAVYALVTSILGASPLHWQVFIIITRWLCVSAFWWLLHLLFPRQPRLAVWASFLFLIYPGFTQHWIALIYGQIYLILAVCFTSLVLSVLALLKPKHYWWLSTLAVLCQAYAIFATEYFFGLELLRPILIWIVLERRSLPWKKRLQTALRNTIPYAAVLLVFLYWRFFAHAYPSGAVLGSQGIWDSALYLAGRVIADFVKTALIAWGLPISIDPALQEDILALLRYLVIPTIVAFSLGIYFALLGEKTSPDQAMKGTLYTRLEPILLGGIAFLFSGLPFWMTSLPLRLGFPWDRYTMPLSVGISLVLAALLEWLITSKPARIAIVTLLIALAGGYHAQNALLYKEDWVNTTAFFWQLSWRAPGLKPGTMLLIDKPLIRFSEDDSLSAPLNWMYAPSLDSRQMPYILFSLSERLRLVIKEIKPGLAVNKNFRATQFSGSTSQALVMQYSPPGCLHILNPEADLYISGSPDLVQRAISLSNLNQIIVDPAQPAHPPEIVYGTEPKHRWCYYFEKADLARQQKQWRQIAALGEEAFRQGYYPADPAEYLPFIEADARLGLWDDAYELTQKAYAQSTSARPALCALWQNLERTTSSSAARQRNLEKLPANPGCR
ncbi:MAG TPA: hypothetical protein VIO61_05700 [Anaerolineaceae bacterium]